MRGSGGCLIAVLCLINAGCDASDRRAPVTTTEPAVFTVRDSAGVTISLSTDSSWTSATAWSIDPEPALQIGSRDGEGPSWRRMADGWE